MVAQRVRMHARTARMHARTARMHALETNFLREQLSLGDNHILL